MAIAVSSWGGDYDTMSWLDQDTGCEGNCTNSPEVVIKNIVYTSGPDPAPTQYQYGQECASEYDCKDVENCPEHMCKWSWPSTDKAQWNSKDAACRCDQTSPGPSGTADL